MLGLKLNHVNKRGPSVVVTIDSQTWIPYFTGCMETNHMCGSMYELSIYIRFLELHISVMVIESSTKYYYRHPQVHISVSRGYLDCE